MKKLCLTLIMLGLVANTPAFALKIIVNDQNDRVVYSRSSKHGPDEYVEEDYVKKEVVTKKTTKTKVEKKAEELATGQVQDINNAQTTVETKTTELPEVAKTTATETKTTVTTVKVIKPGFAHLKELSENLKPEMIGTTWVYDYSEYAETPVEEITETVTEEYVEEPIEQVAEEVPVEEATEDIIEEVVEEPVQEEVEEFNKDENNEYVYQTTVKSPLDLDPTLKKNSREAADYYTRDLNDGNPDLIPSGYEPEI